MTELQVQYKWVVLSNTTLGTLMSSLDTNIVLIALPTIGRDLHTSLFTLLWILLGYQLVTAVLLVNFGRLSDMFGRVRLYNIGFAAFTFGSALCSLSQTGIELVAFRMVQAIGAAFLFSNSAALITDAFPKEERGKALGVNQVSIVAGSVTGLVLGGFLTSTLGWRSVFWVNVPIGAFATIWSHTRLKELGQIVRGQKLDVPGNLLFALGLALVLSGITLYAIDELGLVGASLLMLGGAIPLAAFVAIELRTRQPMFDLSLFRIRMFAASTLAVFLVALARGAVSFVLVFYLQGPTMGLNPLSAGLFLVPISGTLAIFGPISGWLSDNYGRTLFTTLGLGISAIGFLLLTHIGATVSFTELLPGLVFIGCGQGLFASPNRAAQMSAVRPAERGIAAGIGTTLLNVGTTVSLGVAFLVMSKSVPSNALASIFLGYPVSSNAPWIGAFVSSIRDVYFISTAFLIAATVPSLLRGERKALEY